MIEQHYSVKVAAKKLGVCEKTVRRMIDEKLIRAIRIGSILRIPELELIRLIEKKDC